MVRAWRIALAAVLAALSVAAPAAAATRDVLFVGNNWDGTADVIDPQTFARITRLNIVPDLAERLAEIQRDPAAQGYFLAIRQEVGEGHDQLVDDMFSSPDGRLVFVSRPSLADVVAIDLATRKIVWRTHVDGYRADHMAISPDGARLLVSASTAKVVDVLDTATGHIVGRIQSGDQPHESNFSRDGSLIYHASIGTVYTATDDPLLDSTKGERVFEVIDARTLQVLERIDMGRKLAEFGMSGMSSAVRPMALAPDERTVYFQVSFFHGFVEYDLVNDRVTRVANLPLSEKAAKMRREEYVLDSAHHGLAINAEGTKLCAAGTMSDYAAIVSRATFAPRIAAQGQKPYWATNSGDGRYCFVSFSGDDRVAAISYASEQEIASIPVGDHPQRMRMGHIAVASLPAAAARPLRLRVSVRPRRIRAHHPVRLRVRVTARRQGRVVPVAGVRVSVAGVHARTGLRGRAVLRKRLGMNRVGRYRVRAGRGGFRTGYATLRSRR
jgi:DNA-binding beta-propeller fold protein YncE